MAERVLLHVGLMKSGTSFLQEVLRTNQEALREHGFKRGRDEVGLDAHVHQTRQRARSVVGMQR